MMHKTLSLTDNATLTTYFPDNSPEMDESRARSTVIILPGGGYTFTSDREAEPIAIELASKGINAAVLRYSCAPARFPVALRQAAEAVALVRQHAAEWHVRSNKVHVMGFSAGGHLAASLALLHAEPGILDRPLDARPLDARPLDARPDGMILCYPVILSGQYAHDGSFQALVGPVDGDPLASILRQSLSLETRVTPATPPAFIWHTWEDELVPLENSLEFARALRANSVPFEYHIYQKGLHGLSTATKNTINSKGWGEFPSCQNWLDMAIRWILSMEES